MGTNYYVHIGSGDTTPDGHEAEMLHIGKSSMGWVFSLRIYPDRGITTLYDWLPILSNSMNTITDEYGAVIKLDEMISTITDRARKERIYMDEDELDANFADIDWDLNLLRKNYTFVFNKGYGPVGRSRNGEGSWDYCDYEFC